MQPTTGWAAGGRGVGVVAIREDWATGQGYRAGRAIYDAIPGPGRPAWAGDILDLARSAFPITAIPPTVRIVDVIARDPQKWREAHGAFGIVRRLTLAEDESHAGGEAYGLFLLVAEYAAKVVYNASGERGPFDEDCGCCLVSCLRRLVGVVGVPQFEERAWDLLADWLGRCGAEPDSVLSRGLF
jgi:hypothetical protein